jgi:hypothetical protein
VEQQLLLSTRLLLLLLLLLVVVVVPLQCAACEVQQPVSGHGLLQLLQLLQAL